MICNNNYLADILRVCEMKDLFWVMRFQSPLVYIDWVMGYLILEIDLVLVNIVDPNEMPHYATFHLGLAYLP